MSRLGLLLLTAVARAAAGEEGAPARGHADLDTAGVTVRPGLAPADFARALLAETNRVRREHGRSFLRPRRVLDAAADDQAAFMAMTSQVKHESFLRGRTSARERVQWHGLADVYVAENVAMTSVEGEPEETSAERIAAALVEQWMRSPGHRENLLQPKLTHFGGSVRLVRLPGSWRAYGVQVFVRDIAATRKR